MSTAKPPNNPVANGTNTGYEMGEPAFVEPEPDAPNDSTAQQGLDVASALDELASTPIEQIERATAWTWCSRAMASYRLAEEAVPGVERLSRFCDGEAFRQEALEHASMADDTGALLRELQARVVPARRSAKRAVEAGLIAPSVPT